MADINATNLTPETLSTLDGTENIVAFDTAEGKKIPLSVLGDYVVQKLTQTLLGQTQTVQNAFGLCESLVGVTEIPVNSDLNTYTTPGSYYVASTANARTITCGGTDPLPVESTLVVTVRKTKSDATNVIQTLQGYNLFYQMWVRNVNISTGVGTAWVKTPLQADIPNNRVVPSGTNLTMTVPNYSSHLVVLAGQNQDSHAAYIVSQPSSGYTARVSEIFSASDATVSLAATENNHEILITNGSGHDLGVMVITFKGNALTPATS